MLTGSHSGHAMMTSTALARAAGQKRTAVVVADHQDVLDLEVVHAVLQARHAVGVLVRGQVADVALHEHLAQAQAQHRVGLPGRERTQGLAVPRAGNTLSGDKPKANLACTIYILQTTGMSRISQRCGHMCNPAAAWPDT